jgi:hypothetical protein
MRKFIAIMCLMITGVLFSYSLAAAEDSPAVSPWEKYSFSLGYLVSSMDTSIRMGGGTGLDIDLEDTLNLESSMSVVRLEGLRRFNKHRIDLSWVALKREATRTVGEDFTIKNNEGEEVTISAGSVVDSYLNLDLYKLTYSYSFIQDERLDLAGIAGFYVAPISVGISAQGLVDKKGTQSFTAPLPLIGLRMDFAVTPRWFIRYQAQCFYLAYKNFNGSIYSSTAAVEYKPWENAGFGLGYDIFRMKLEADGQDYPGVDLRGNVGFQYAGLMLYAKLFF